MIIDFLKSIDLEKTDPETVEILKGMGKAVEDAMGDFMKDKIDSKSLNDAIAEAIKNIDSKKELDAVKSQLSEVSETLVRIKGAMEKSPEGEYVVKSIGKQIEDACKSYIVVEKGVKKLNVAAIKEKGSMSFDLVLKADPVVSMTTGGSPVAGGLTIDNEISVQPRKQYTLRDVCNVAPIATRSVIYAEMTNVTGDAAWVPEGGLKPSMKATLRTNEVSVGKIALMATITEEVLMDIPQFEEEIKNEIINRIEKKEEEGVLNGSGKPGEVKGVAIDFPAFSLTGIEVSKSPNMYDAIVAAYTQIVSTSNMSYSPNAVRMNPVDYANMQLTKNDNGDYIRPFKIGDELITGLKVIKDGNEPVGSFKMGDFNYLYIRDYKVLTIKLGWVNDDFANNRVTMLGEKLLLAYVKSQYKTAFVADTFANVITAITKTA